MTSPRPGGGWLTAGTAPPPVLPSIDYWKQHQHRQLIQQQQQQLVQQQPQLQQKQQQYQQHESSDPVQQQQQQQQQQTAGCEPAPAAGASAADGQCSNYVTTVLVSGWQTPASPRCESARSDAAESSCSSLSQESLSPPARPTRPPAAVRSVVAPDGWNRVTSNGLVVYVSPSGASLTSGEEARQYLRAAGTCKCGLECPILVEKSFNFDPKVITRPRSGGGVDSPSQTTKTCNHRRRRAELLRRHAARPDVPPTFQEQRCNPHNNPFFREQMLQAMEQMSFHQQQHLQQHQQQHHQPQQPPGLRPQAGPRPAVAPSCWPPGGVGRLPAPPAHLLRAHWDELRRRRTAGRGRRRASPCPNVDVRQMPAAAEQRTPSFLDDPSGYLARQTQLLNDTMQEGLSPAPASEVPLPSTVPLPARVGKHAPAEAPTAAAPDPHAAGDAAAAAPAAAAAAPVTSSGCELSAQDVSSAAVPVSGPAATCQRSSPSPSEPAVSVASASSPSPGEPAAVSASPAACQPEAPAAAGPPPPPTVTAAPTDRGGDAAAVSTAGSVQERPAVTAATAAAAAAAAHHPVMGSGEVPLVQQLPAGQIILPSGQVILTQPFQPMLQYVNALPMQQPLVVSSGALLHPPPPAQSQLADEPSPTQRESPGRRRRRRQTPTVAAMLQRSQQQQQQQHQQQHQQQQQHGGLQTVQLAGGGGGAVKQPPAPVVISAAPTSVGFLQPVLLPGSGGGQLFIQNVGGPLLSTTLAGQPGGQLLQVVSVMTDSCQSVLPPPPPPPPPADGQQTCMAADSSTSGHVSPDAGGCDGGAAGASPGPQEEPVSSTGEPADEPARADKRMLDPAEDGEPEPTFCAGDLVWGSHHGLRSWPGQVVERTDVQTCGPSEVWVQWFGDHTMSLQSTDQLRNFHDLSTSKRSKSSVENSSFEEALKEALLAVERQRK